MRKIFLYMTMTLDGFIAGPGNELDWMNESAGSDPELNKDIVTLISRADTGFMGYLTALGMIPYWSNIARDPIASQGDRELAGAIS
ncbi:MAG: hypothetical protein ACXWNC_02155, partial [Anaerolineales bacterium]